MELQDTMFIGYLKYLFENTTGEERDEKAKKAVLGYLLALEWRDKKWAV